MRTLADWLPQRRDLGMIVLGVAVVFAVLNGLQVVKVIRFWEISGGQQDWANFVLVDPSAPYANSGYVWSPILGWPLQVLPLIGFPAWTVLKTATLLLLPWRIALMVLATWPFWGDAMTGNAFIPVFVAMWLAPTGSRWGTWWFLFLAILIPRPLMLPVLGWVLWKRPEYRVPFAVLFTLHAVVVVASGQLDDWAAQLARISAWEVTRDINLTPSRWIGGWWALVALPLAALLTWKGRLGFASVAACVYMHSNYWLLLLLELAPTHEEGARRRRAVGSTALSLFLRGVRSLTPPPRRGSPTA